MVIKKNSRQKSILPCGRPELPKKEWTQSKSDLLTRILLQLNTYCLSKKLNRSDAREKILEIIVTESRHFTAIDLLENLQKRFPEIGKATMYRNLPLLVESGILQEGPHDSNGQVLYELSGEDHHDHIVCLDCRRIFEFHDNAIEKRQEAVAAELEFKPVAHRHVIYAHCTFLAKKTKSKDLK
jgi:Fur family ferric uptake transcriptional regulator